jgi:hypothetical protein
MIRESGNDGKSRGLAPEAKQSNDQAKILMAITISTCKLRIHRLLFMAEKPSKRNNP